MKKTARTRLTQKEIGKLSERVKPLTRDVVGGGPFTQGGNYGTLDSGALSCSGKPRNC